MRHSSPHFPVESITSQGQSPADSSQAVVVAKSSTDSQPVERKNTRKVFSQRTNSLLGVQIVATGSYVPDQVVTNADLQAERGFDPDWINQRTGILERRHARPEQATSDLCIEAARRAIRAARIDPSEIDLVLVGTFTPDYNCPSTACLVQDKLGLDAPAVDLQAACSGFMYSLITGAQFVATGNSKMALIIGGDCNTRIIDPLDRRIAPLFGDGAGAVLLTAGDPHQGLICYQLGADGSGGSLLQCAVGGTRNPVTADDVEAGRHFLSMDGRTVFKWAVRVLTDTVELTLAKSGMGTSDVSLFLIHQANKRIIDAAITQLGVEPDRVYSNLERFGNTSGGSIPLALDEAYRAGRINRGDTILMCGFGAGLTWGTSLFRW